MPWLHPECPTNLRVLSVDRTRPGFEGREPRRQMFPDGQLSTHQGVLARSPGAPFLHSGSLLAQVQGMGQLAFQALPPSDYRHVP